MKYKIGDKVKIKTWMALCLQYGCLGSGAHLDTLGIKPPDNDYISSYTYFMETELNKKFPDRILTIKTGSWGRHGVCFQMEETNTDWDFYHYAIEALIEKAPVESDFIQTRFEILDI